MRKKTITAIVGVLFFIIPVLVFPLDLRDIKSGGTPIITDKGVVFRYKPKDEKKHVVYVSGDFNNWEKPIRMSLNVHNVYVCIYDRIGERGIVINNGTYRYRFLVDGLWIKDPDNPDYTVDDYGTKLSLFKIDKPVIVIKNNPIHLKDNFYLFYYRDEKAKSVFLVGDFNFWNAFSLPMHKNSAGLWEVIVDIPPGRYAYRFLVDGKYRIDPFGKMVVYDRFSKEMSIVRILGR